MFAVVRNSSNAVNLSRVVTQSYTIVVAPAPVVPPEPKETPVLQPWYRLKDNSLAGPLPTSNTKLFGVIDTPLRYAHTDLKVPSWDDVRRTSSLNPNAKTNENESRRKVYSYLVFAGALSATIYGSKVLTQFFVLSMAPAKSALAVGKIEIKLSAIPEGQNITFKWRGKPLFVRHRTEEEIAREQAQNLAELKDPQHDNDRVQDPKYLVVLGICTHLGCVPISHEGDYGGYYCPCHGSHYDASGRVRKGPAPFNLEVPEYSFPEPGILVVG